MQPLRQAKLSKTHRGGMPPPAHAPAAAPRRKTAPAALADHMPRRRRAEGRIQRRPATPLARPRCRPRTSSPAACTTRLRTFRKAMLQQEHDAVCGSWSVSVLMDAACIANCHTRLLHCTVGPPAQAVALSPIEGQSVKEQLHELQLDVVYYRTRSSPCWARFRSALRRSTNSTSSL